MTPSELSNLFGFNPQGSKLPRMDPALGRGYRIGQLREVPALAGQGTVPEVLLANHAHIEQVTPFKVILGVLDEAGNDPGVTNGARLRFNIRSSVENDRISRVCDVSVNNATVLYVTGRKIEISVANPQNFMLQAQMAMDEWQPGVSTWYASQFFTALAAETPLDIPPFCLEFRVYTPSGMGGPRLRGYAPGGTLVYNQVLAVPDSGDIERVPGLDYTLTPTVPGTNHVVNYTCFG